MKTTLPVQGMSCMGCVNTIKKVLLQVPGVKDVSVELKPFPAASLVSIEHGDNTPRPELEAAIEDAGYEVEKQG